MINFNGSNVGEMYYGSTPISQAYFGSNLIYQSTPASALLYTSAFDFTARAGTTNNILVNQTLPTSSYDYFSLKFGLAFTAAGEDDFSIQANNQNWDIIWCSPIGSTEVPLYWGTPQSPVNLTYTGCTQRTQDSGKKKIMSYNGLSNRVLREYKMIYNNNNNSITMYYDGTPYVTLNNIPNPVSSINKIYHHCWTTFSCTARMSGCHIAGFKDLTAAQAW